VSARRSILGPKFTALALALLAAVAVMPATSMAVGPSPQLQSRMAKSSSLRTAVKKQMAAMKAAGVDRPSARTAGPAGHEVPWGAVSSSAGLASAAPGTGTYHQLVLLVDFSDKVATTAASKYDDLMFKDVTGPASVRGYYREASAGKLDIQGVAHDMPSALGWIRMPQTYAYYVNADNGWGSYPQNSQKLMEDAFAAAEAKGVDFSQYDNDGDGYIDGVILIHAGQGAEATGSDYDIWSHKWQVAVSKTYDGVRTSSYTTEPEYWFTSGDMTVGVFCHELGHVFGLPDLYDTDYSSEGVGDWSLMAGGSWNGSLGNSPSRFDAWSAIKLGFASSTVVTSRSVNAEFTAGTTTAQPSIFRVEKGATSGASQYFLLENRQKTGTDSGLDGSGLLIWHIDNAMTSNDDETHQLVSLEEAHGGTQHLRTSGYGRGDAGDPFPGSSVKRSFTATSDPSSAYYSSVTSIAVTAISNSSATMTALIQPTYPLMSDDSTPPVTTSDAVSSYDGTATISLEATDGVGGTGVASTHWTLDGVAHTGTGPIVVPRYGSHTLTFWSVDFNNNVETSHTVLFTVSDIDAPAVSTDAVASYVQTATVHITATDGANGIGLASIGYRVDGAATQTVAASPATLSFTTTGAHTLEYWATDSAGNSSAHRFASLTVFIDHIAPVTTSDAQATYEGTATITLSPTDVDGSGVTSTHWLLDGVAGTGVTVTAHTAGLHQLTFWSVDLAGNAETPNEVTFAVHDPVAPSASLHVDALYTGYATITLSAVDPANGTGVKAISYRVDEAATTTVLAPSTTFDIEMPGEHTITYWATDNAQNVSAAQVQSVTIAAGTTVYISTKPKTVSAGTKVAVSGHIDLATIAVNPLGQYLQLQKLVDGAWVSASSVDAPLWTDGTYTFASVKVYSNTSLRVVTRKGSDLAYGHSEPLLIKATAVLSKPTLSTSTPRRNAKFKASGTVSPAHASTVSVRWYKVSRSGKRTAYGSAQTVTLSSAGKWSIYKRLGHGRWAVKATHADAGHVSHSSAYRTFSVN